MSTILIADDIEANRYFLEALLKGHGHRVVVAGNGAEALIATRREKPELIVSDILMPEMDGFVFCRTCKSDPELADIPFVFYTATYTDPKDEAFGLGLGAERYVIKPLDPVELMSILDEVMEQAKERRTKQAGTTVTSETGYLREHNEALTRRLESKMIQLEEANRCLRLELAERRQAEIRLRRLSTAMENAEECILTTNAQGAVEYVNPAFEKITGIDRDEILGRRPDDMLLDDCPFPGESFADILRQSVSSEKPRAERYRMRRGSNELLDLDVTTSPIPDESGNIDGHVLLMRDVTRQKKLENQLIQAQKFEALGTLAGGIAHDFNNVLNVIVGYTDLILLDTPPEGRLRDNLAAVLKACDRAKSLIRQILTFSRKTDHHFENVDLLPLVQETIKFLKAAFPPEIEIRTRLEASGAFVSADPAQIHQVLLNVGTNAAYAMKNSGGVLEVTLKRVDLDANTSRQHPDLKTGDYLLLSVGDTGCGMDETTLSRIFEPFYTTKREGEGTGLGLALVHGIVRNHNGAVTVYSEQGSGSTFNIHLPAIACVPDSPDDSGREPPPPMGTERILLVDDEELLADIGKQIFERLGYRVTALTSGIEALELFQENPDAFDLVLTDQAMPRITGRELAEKIYGIRPEIPVIICTGFSTEISGETPPPGVKKILMKPLVIREMARAVRDVLDETKGAR